MPDFLINNTFGIVTFVVGLAVTIIIYFLQTRRANSAKQEREKQSKKEIIDTIENYIINDKQVEESTFLNLKSGIERSNGLILDKDWNWMALLQDISFRLQTSRHLATDQKLDYAKKLDILIENWNTKSALSRKLHSTNEQDLIDKILAHSIEKDEKTQNELKGLLSELLTIRRYNNAKLSFENERKITVITRAITSTFAGLTASIGVYFIANSIDKKLSNQSNTNNIASQELIKTGIQLGNDYQTLLISGIVLISIIVILVVILFYRNKNRMFKEYNIRLIGKNTFRG